MKAFCAGVLFGLLCFYLISIFNDGRSETNELIVSIQRQTIQELKLTVDAQKQNLDESRKVIDLQKEVISEQKHTINLQIEAIETIYKKN